MLYKLRSNEVENVIKTTILHDWLNENFKIDKISFFSVRYSDLDNIFYINACVNNDNGSSECIPVQSHFIPGCTNGKISPKHVEKIIEHRNVPEIAYVRIVEKILTNNEACYGKRNIIKTVSVERNHLLLELPDDNTRIEETIKYLKDEYCLETCIYEKNFSLGYRYITAYSSDWKNTCTLLKLRGFIE